MKTRTQLGSAEEADLSGDLTDQWLVRLTDAHFAYPGGRQAVGGVDLQIRRQEVLSIVGPSGCGKTTLLNLLAGLRKPTSGSVRWNEDLLANTVGRRPKRRRMTLVFQKDTVLPWLTVEQNVGFGLKYLDLTADSKRARIEDLLQMGRLEDVRDAYPKQLSGGMRRRVALLTGIAPLPHLLVLDEPFAALDEPTRVNIHSDLLEIVHRLGLSVVLVTHDLSEAITLSDRVMVATQRPTRVASLAETGLGRPRDVRKVRESPRYHEFYSSTWHEVWVQSDKQEAAQRAKP